MRAQYLVEVELPETATQQTFKSWIEDALEVCRQNVSYAKKDDIKADTIFVSNLEDNNL